MAGPLNELLAAALADFTREFERAGEDRLKPPSLEIHANLLRVLSDDRTDIRDIPALARVSKRAVRWNANVARRLGWIDEHAKHLELTAAGRSIRDESERSLRAAEAAWTKRIGAPVLARLRGALEALVNQFDLELPHHPAGYGPADSSVTGGVAMRWGRGHALRVKGLPGHVFDPAAEQKAADAWEDESGGRLYVRTTGQDWRPVARGEGDTVSHLPLFALLSQVLMAFAIDYEGCGGLAMARSGNVLRNVTDEGIDVEIRPSRSKGMSAFIPVDSSAAGLERHAYVSVEPDKKDKRKGRLTLTEKGRRIRDAYDDIVFAIEERWKRRYGADVVRGFRRALEAVAD